MIKFIILFISTMILCSCSRYAQVYYTASKDGSTRQQASFHVYENDSIRIAYLFWDVKGSMSFMVENKLSVPLYIDWNRSSLIVKGEKKNYFSNSRSIHQVGVSITSASLFAPLFTTVAAINGIEVKEEKVTFIPPHSHIYKNTSYDLIDGYMQKKKEDTRDVVVNGRKCKERLINAATTKLVFRNFLTYSITESFTKEQYIDNSFYVSKVQTMKSKYFAGNAVYDSKGHVTFSNPFWGPDRFYLNGLYKSDVY